MPIDPAGTTPGLQKAEESPKEVHIRCKSSGCDSILAIEIDIPGQRSRGNRLYQCCKCKRTWGVPVGGAVDL